MDFLVLFHILQCVIRMSVVMVQSIHMGQEELPEGTLLQSGHFCVSAPFPADSGVPFQLSFPRIFQILVVISFLPLWLLWAHDDPEYLFNISWESRIPSASLHVLHMVGAKAMFVKWPELILYQAHYEEQGCFSMISNYICKIYI